MSHSDILSEIFSSRAAAQIIDFFLDHKEFDYSPSEVAQKTGLSFKTIFREIPNLEKYQLIKKNRKIGKTSMYILNSGLPAITYLEKFALEVSGYKLSQFDSIPDADNKPYDDKSSVIEKSTQIKS
jgi:DNA replication protein DnaD